MLRPACSSESMRAACPARARAAWRRWTASAARSPRSRACSRRAGGRRAGAGPRRTRQPFAAAPSAEGDAEARGVAQRLAAAQHLALGRPLVERPDLPGGRIVRARAAVIGDAGAASALASATRASSAPSCSMTRQRSTPGSSASARAILRQRLGGILGPGRGATHRGEGAAVSQSPVAGGRFPSPVAAGPALLEEPLQVAGQELPLAAGRAAAGHDARVRPATQRVLTDLQHLGRGRHPQPATAAAWPPPLSLRVHTAFVGRSASFLYQLFAHGAARATRHAALPSRRGGTLWLSRNTLSGSQRVFTSTRRS